MSTAMILAMMLQAASTSAVAPPAPPPPPPPPPVTYTNEEQVYFEREAGREPPPWLGYRVVPADNDMWQRVDAAGRALSGPEPRPADGDGQAAMLTVTVDGHAAILRRARNFTCWVSVRRFADRADGQADWSFDRNLALHDQGGRVLVQPDGAPPVVIRMRNVVWPPPSTNRPSLVLYVHRPESPDRAESYSWADPDARMVGINLRWVQASCTRVGDAS